MTLRRLGMILAALALVGAAEPPEREKQPGEQVLCIAALVYFAKLQADACHAGKDPAYQTRLSGYTDRFDAYLVRNFEGGEVDLARFKEQQGLTSPADKRICEQGEDYDFYGSFKQMPKEAMDEMVDSLLERDGPPTFGDCL